MLVAKLGVPRLGLLEAHFDLTQLFREARYGYPVSFSALLVDYTTNAFLGTCPEYACMGLQLLSKLLCCADARGAVHPMTTKIFCLQSRCSLLALVGAVDRRHSALNAQQLTPQNLPAALSTMQNCTHVQLCTATLCAALQAVSQQELGWT